MEPITFYKYEGAGNDFIMINNFNNNLAVNQKEIAYLCDRHFGIGADGLILLEEIKGYDFKMVYYNADGSPAKMCGNGSRCAVAFAKDLELVKQSTTFIVDDMIFKGKIDDNYLITILMPNECNLIYKNDEEYFFTISKVPHIVKFVNNLISLDILPDAKRIRHAKSFEKTNGTNVNYIEKISNNILYVRTYEKGVEDETLACGTGIIASTLSIAEKEDLQGSHVFTVKAKGGELTIGFEKNAELFSNITMTGYSNRIFKGKTYIKSL
ncbi:MAG: diaminopimelate epimerase [Solitalea-like symbiont of Tyrophagus putrescentiae]